MKNVVKLAQETRKKNARPTDDRRSLVQSIVIASIPSTQQRLNAKERQLTIPSSTEIAQFLGLNRRSFNRIKQKAQDKRDLLEEVADGSSQTGTLFSQVVKRKGWTKVNKELEEKVVSFIKNHPNVVQSPIMNDYVSVKDTVDPSVVQKVPKLLLQVSIRELHNDLIEQLPEASKDGIPLISDTKLREMMPPQVKKMTERYKEMCGCTDCVSIGYFHRDNNVYTMLFGNNLKKIRD